MIKNPMILVGEYDKPATDAQPICEDYVSPDTRNYEQDVILLQSMEGANALRFW